MRIEFLHLCCTLYYCFLFFFFKDHSFPYGSFSAVWYTFCGFGQMPNDKNTSLHDYTDYFHCPENYLDSSSCLENPMDGGAWWAAVHGVTKSWTRLSDFTFTFTFMHWRKKWKPTPVFLPGRIPGTGKPGGLLSMRSHRIGNDWSDLAAAAAGASYFLGGFPGDTNGKQSGCQFRRHKRCGFDSWVRKIPWKREWPPTPVFLPKEFHGQRSLVGYNP